MSHGIALRQDVRDLAQLARVDLLGRGDELRQRVARGLGLLGGDVQFGAVAGGDDRRLSHVPGVAVAQTVAQAGDHAGDLIRHESHPLSQRQRSGLVIDSEGQQLHGRCRLRHVLRRVCRCGSVGPGESGPGA